MTQFLYVALGLFAGALGGIFGIGGAIVLIPAMVYLGKMTQHQAQGTALAALLPPVGLLAVLTYWQQGNVKLPIAVLICAGFFFGGLIGGNLAQFIPGALLKKIFGIFLLLIALNMILGK
ncbi:MAG: TSUP family transporter [Candidatus Omnitrophota bacterium]|nr:TSUP family transporter [Candidatus Omnitrophota bacterium]